MKKIIKKILNEENSLRGKFMQMMKTKGVDLAAESVGGFDNLNKILKLDLDDIDVQEMLVKNFINFVEISEIEVTGLEIKNSSSGNRVINILFTTESNASNIESWLVRDIIEYLSKFFPFPIKAVWEPSFGGNTKISLGSELVNDEEIQESIIKEDDEKAIRLFKRRLDLEYMDWLIDNAVISIERRFGSICSMGDDKVFIQGVTELVSEDLYNEYFYDIFETDNDEWDPIYRFIFKFIESEYGVELRYRFNKACRK
jgi:hypothetical protein